MEPTNKTILVTGASGTQGEPVVLELLRSGFKVRALVFSSEPKHLKEAGAEIVKGSFDDIESLEKAMEGVYGVFSMQNIDFTGGDSERRHAQNIVDAAKKAGVKQIVHTSVAQAGNHEKFPGWQEGRWSKIYWVGKHDALQIIINAGFEYWTVLKPAVLMENFTTSKVESLSPYLKHGEIVTASKPETKLHYISAEDVAKYASAAFLSPETYHQQSIDLAAEALTWTEVADKLNAVLGKKIKVTYVSSEEALKRGFDPFVVLYIEWQTEIGYNVDVEAVKKRSIPLTSFDEFVKKYQDKFIVGN